MKIKSLAHQIEELISNWPTMFKPGFTAQEQVDLIDSFEFVDYEKYCENVGINTGIIRTQNNKSYFITYHCDVYYGLMTTLRDLPQSKWVYKVKTDNKKVKDDKGTE